MSYKNEFGIAYLKPYPVIASNSTILVVEDNETEQYLLRILLEKFDYNVEIISSGEKALEALSGGKRYAAVLMDITLPGIDGCECVRRMRQLKSSARTPVIALTSRSEPEDRKTALQSGMDDYLQKPFDPEELRKLLLRYVYDASKPNLKTLRPLPPGEA